MIREFKHTPGPWTVDNGGVIRLKDNSDSPRMIVDITTDSRIKGEDDANAALIAAAPDLLHAARLLEGAEHQHANCDDCEGENVPELCGTCFPYFDDARIARRLAIAKATGIAADSTSAAPAARPQSESGKP